MDIFRVLSRGASLKKSKDYKSDFTAPDKEKSTNELKKEKELEIEVDKELDFFHSKQHKLVKEIEVEKDDDNEDDESKEENGEENEDSTKKQKLAKITTKEEAIKLRIHHGSKVTGYDIPLPIGSFEDLISRFKLSKVLLQNLIHNNFNDPTAIQSEAIPCSLFGRDLIACAPTGSGKTLAFLIPLVQNIINSNKKISKDDKKLKGLIISPTKELAQQINNQLIKLTENLNINSGYLNKSLASKFRSKNVKSNKFDVIVTTPLRLIDLIKNETIDLSTVEYLVFDEADSLFQSDFLEQTDSILSSLTNTKLIKSIFSATITSHVEELAHGIMTDPIRVIIGLKEAANSSIEQKIIYCGDEHGKLVAIRDIIQNGGFKPPVIIFLQSIDRAKALFNELLYDGLNVDVIHAERTQKQREDAINRFKTGELWCLITTDVLARGIDFKGINLVINYDVPNSSQAYVHRIGRTGRAGRAGRAITFYTKEDTDMIKNVINVMRASGQTDGMPEWMRDETALSKLSKDRKRKLKREQLERGKISTVPKAFKKRKFRKV
ncbi:RNA-dependent ATPase rok1 [Pichia californica]|uniref:RNA helicase n=1 Tax=Pichia californica TaxID=460514 RepID=A0A9P6WMJ9_9ASCO|nr:RNA-dependent ATPase rok1 [[Candida] californica]KAG0688768.1 RNA-dependent ATPase rok1 [[Candida] californica]